MSPSIRSAAIAAAVFLAGCAATVQRPAESQAPVVVSPAAAKKIVLVVQGSGAAARSADWQALREEWRTAMSAAAAAAGVTYEWRDSASSLPRTAGTAVVIKVDDYRYLSTGARYGLGAFAGNAYINADGEFRDLQSGRILGTRKYNTSSSAWQGIFSAMTSKQVEAICNQIVSDVTGR